MKKLAICLAVLLCFLCPAEVLAADLLVPVGEVVGLELKNNQVTVAAFAEPLGLPTKQAGLREGDVLSSINGTEIQCAEDVRTALSDAGEQIEVDVERGGKSRHFSLKPQNTPEGPRLGIYLRQGISGIGTVTWYDPDTGKFGTLGHGVSGSGGNLLDMTSGTLYQAEISSVRKGTAGQPGQLRGTVKEVFGQLEENTPQGVFGTSETGWKGEPVPVAESGVIHTGPAKIRSTVSGDSPREYSVDILKIYPPDGENRRNFMIRVTDPALLDATGGIGQGMSGSPIIQAGKLVGAVTHVLVNDPTKGYGILIENMLNAAE